MIGKSIKTPLFTKGGVFVMMSIVSFNLNYMAREGGYQGEAGPKREMSAERISIDYENKKVRVTLSSGEEMSIDILPYDGTVRIGPYHEETRVLTHGNPPKIEKIQAPFYLYYVPPDLKGGNFYYYNEAVSVSVTDTDEIEVYGIPTEGDPQGKANEVFGGFVSRMKERCDRQRENNVYPWNDKQQS